MLRRVLGDYRFLDYIGCVYFEKDVSVPGEPREYSEVPGGSVGVPGVLEER